MKARIIVEFEISDQQLRGDAVLRDTAEDVHNAIADDSVWDALSGRLPIDLNTVTVRREIVITED